MAVTAVRAEQSSTRPAVNLRVDRWWVQPAVTVVVLTLFVAYSTWTVFTPHDYFAGNVGRPYLSPYYSPCITDHCGGGTTWRLVTWWPWSAGILMMAFPILFRATCYYYRKAYYRSFWLSPPACAVAEPHQRYTGEGRFPLILQNIHRYTFYLIIPFPLILLWEAVKAVIRWPAPNTMGFGLGTLFLFVNALLLLGYTLGCHAGRHICGGHLNAMSKGPVRYWIWKRMTWFNSLHMQWAWVSLVFVAWTDIYIRLVASGTIHDPRFF